MATPIYAKNITGNIVSVNDLSGLRIEPYSEVDLREFFTIDEIDFHASRIIRSRIPWI